MAEFQEGASVLFNNSMNYLSIQPNDYIFHSSIHLAFHY